MGGRKRERERLRERERERDGRCRYCLNGAPPQHNQPREEQRRALICPFCKSDTPPYPSLSPPPSRCIHGRVAGLRESTTRLDGQTMEEDCGAITETVDAMHSVLLVLPVPDSGGRRRSFNNQESRHHSRCKSKEGRKWMANQKKKTIETAERKKTHTQKKFQMASFKNMDKIRREKNKAQH